MRVGVAMIEFEIGVEEVELLPENEPDEREVGWESGQRDERVKGRGAFCFCARSLV